MIIKNVEFIKSSIKPSQCPEPNKPEFAFIGRSNVGKSSLINMLTDRKNLAKTSNRPGKTQLLNHFLVNDQWYLVDLPGYGYAKVSKDKRKVFKGMMLSYLESRPTLLNTFVLLDARLPPQQVDLDFMIWMGEKGLPFFMVFTKADKLGKNQVQSNVALYRKEMLKIWEEVPPMVITSSETGTGKEELLMVMGAIMDELPTRGMQQEIQAKDSEDNESRLSSL